MSDIESLMQLAAAINLAPTIFSDGKLIFVTAFQNIMDDYRKKLRSNISDLISEFTQGGKAYMGLRGHDVKGKELNEEVESKLNVISEACNSEYDSEAESILGQLANKIKEDQSRLSTSMIITGIYALIILLFSLIGQRTEVDLEWIALFYSLVVFVLLLLILISNRFFSLIKISYRLFWLSTVTLLAFLYLKDNNLLISYAKEMNMGFDALQIKNIYVIVIIAFSPFIIFPLKYSIFLNYYKFKLYLKYAAYMTAILEKLGRKLSWWKNPVFCFCKSLFKIEDLDLEALGLAPDSSE